MSGLLKRTHKHRECASTRWLGKSVGTEVDEPSHDFAGAKAVISI